MMQPRMGGIIQANIPDKDTIICKIRVSALLNTVGGLG